MIADSDLSRDCRHGLSQSAVRKSGPDYTIMPTYSVIQQYVGLKLASGPHSTTRVSTAQYSRVHERVCSEQKSYRTMTGTFTSVPCQKSACWEVVLLATFQ